MGLDSAQSHECRKDISRKPVFVSLRRKGFLQISNLGPAHRAFEFYEQIWRAEIAVVLRDLVLENEVVSKCVPGQFVDEPMILVQVGPIVGEDQIWIDRAFHPFEFVFDFGPPIGEEAIAMRADGDTFISCAFQE